MVFGVIGDFDAASGLSATELNVFFKSVTVSIGAVLSSWFMVAGIRAWMRGQADELETGFVLVRAVLLVVILGALLNWF